MSTSNQNELFYSARPYFDDKFPIVPFVHRSHQVMAAFETLFNSGATPPGFDVGALEDQEGQLALERKTIRFFKTVGLIGFALVMRRTRRRR